MPQDPTRNTCAWGTRRRSPPSRPVLCNSTSLDNRLARRRKRRAYDVRKNTMESATNQEIISCQLVRIAAELRKLELIANASAIDPTILADFRSAVDHARSTAWAVQHCLLTRADDLDVYPILVRERIRRVIELCEALLQDLSSPQRKTETAANELLYRAARRLCDYLDHGPR